MSTPENRVKAKCTAILKKHKAFYFFPAMGLYGRRGVPDIICCVKGRFLGIECKAGKGQLTDMQMHTLAQIEDAGGVSIVVRESNIDLLKDLMGALSG